MKIVIIEDEQLSADHLAAMLKKADPSAEVLAVFASVKSSVEAFKKGLRADLLLVDIHLADGLSFEIFDEVHLDLPIIFTTAYDHYAIRAFKLNSVDYLLKPVGLDELKQALTKHKRLSENVLGGNTLAALYKPFSPSHKTRFMVKANDSIISIKTDDIHHFVAEDGICLLVNDAGRRFPVDYTLDQLEGLVPRSEFFRINRKVLIGYKAVTRISSYLNGRLKIAANGLEADLGIVSRERVADFKQWLDQ